MNHRLTIRRHGRAIAMVGALVAVGATTTMALVAGTASAAPTATQPGTCIDNVNVRADASTTSKIVAVCETGTAVTVAETRDGFVHLTNLKGWAAQEFVSVNGKTAPAPAERAAPSTTPAPDTDTADTGTADSPEPDPSGPAARTPGTSGNNIGDAGDDDATNSTADDATADDQSGDDQSGDDQSADDQGSGTGSPVGGLLG